MRPPSRYSASELISFAAGLLAKTGLDADKAQTVAEILVEADLLGHTTHGLQLLASYLGELEKGAMAKTGAPRVVVDSPAAVTWDGMRLPGPWLTVKAFDLAMERARNYGTCTVAISRSHHIACLAAYLKRVTDAGLMGLLTCSAPDDHAVAAHGGRLGIMSPNPIAAAWPTEGDPVILDMSMSIASNGQTRRALNEGWKFPSAWLVDAQGHPTSEPAALFTQPPGALLPIGGVDHGHKGYALLLLVEALTGGLAGHGRADPLEGWSACVFLQVFDPALFGGAASFTRQTESMARICRETPPRAGFERVRLPGESGLRRREVQLREGVELYPSIMPGLLPWAEKLKVQVPTRLD
jgi:LDH2 family malate/lactate/ureidoglycolate dehydrogenase